MTEDHPKKSEIRYSMRIDPELRDQFHAAAKYEGVSAAAGLPYKHGMAVTGHTQERTFRQYITTDLEMVRRIGKLLK